MTHKSPVSCLSDDFEEDDVMQVQAGCSVTAFAENLDEKRIVVGTLLVLKAIYFLLPWR